MFSRVSAVLGAGSLPRSMSVMRSLSGQSRPSFFAKHATLFVGEQSALVASRQRPQAERERERHHQQRRRFTASAFDRAVAPEDRVVYAILALNTIVFVAWQSESPSVRDVSVERVCAPLLLLSRLFCFLSWRSS